MSPYFLARVAHLAGAAFFFLAIGFEWAALRTLRRARDGADLTAGVADFRTARRLDNLGALLSLSGGVYLATTVWQWHGGWLHTGATLFIVIWAITGAVSGRTVRRLTEANRVASMPRLFIALASRLGLLLAVLALMVMKPGPAVQGPLVLASQLGALGVWLRLKGQRETA